MMKKQRCGTGDPGCCGPSMDHSSSDMCNGVFAPVCAPEICNVPRIPHHQKLVEGAGYILDTESRQKIPFSILVEREMQVYKGVFKAQGTGDCMAINAQVLKFFEGDGKTHMFAVFHEEATNRDIVVTIYKQAKGHQGYEGQKECEEQKGYEGQKECEEQQGCEGHQEYEGYQKHQAHCKEVTHVFIYSTSMEGTLINLGGELVAGDIKLYVDQNVHEH